HSIGEYEQALALFKKVLGMDPLFPPARWHVGEILRKTGDPQGAMREHQKILELTPKSVPALGLLAMAHRTAGDVGSARRALEQARGQGPPDYTWRLHWALQLAVEGKRDEALREMDAEVLKYAELHIVCVPLAAEFYAVLGDKAKGLDWLDRAVRAGDEEAEW